MKKILALLLAVLTAAALASCGLPFAPKAPAESAGEPAAEQTAPAGPAVTLRLGAPEDDAALCARLDEAAARLRGELPDIAVVREALPADGAPPDLLVLGEAEAAALCAEGALLDLAEEAEAAALAETLDPVERARLAVFAGLPAEPTEFYCFFANKARFDELGLALPADAASLLVCARAFAAAGRGLFPADGETARVLFALLLCAEGGRGPEALRDGSASPYDDAYLFAADELYRLQRAGAFSAESEAESALLLLPSGEASRVHELWGEDAAPLSFPGAGAGETALGPATERRVLAVSAASEHPTLAVTAACRLCELLGEADADALTVAVAALRSSLSRIETLAPPGDDALGAAYEAGVRELSAGTMTPDEFVEVLALSLER